MIMRGAVSPLLRLGLRKDMRDGYEMYPLEWPEFLRTGTMDRAEIELITMSGLPRQVPRGEGESYTFVDPKVGAKVTKTDTEFGLGFSVSQQTEEDELYGKVRQSAKWLGRSVKLAQEYESAEMLDDAFAGTTFTGMQGEPLISATHTLLNSAETWSNLIPGNPQFGVAGLQAAFELGENTVDQQGDPVPVRIDKIIGNVANEWKFIQLTQNPDEPYTAERNINATRRKRQLSYVINHYKDQTGKDWFGLDSRLNDAWLTWKVKPQFPDWYDKATSASYFASRQRFLNYFWDQRGWVGSNAT